MRVPMRGTGADYPVIAMSFFFLDALNYVGREING